MANNLSIEITDSDIDWVEGIMNGVTFDSCRREIIKNLDTIDVQAFPGSGKTTLLVAKLAILANKWKHTHKGLCVLSHTNVAREEIVKHLGQTSVGKKLLTYPHFIGTLHSFFGTFAGLPWLRSKGIDISIIDTSLVQELRWKRLNRNYRYALEKKFITSDCCKATELPLKIQVGRIPTTTATYNNVFDTVKISHSKGEFTFDEILLYAADALRQVPELFKYIACRFPIVFIDEAQDTCKAQWDLINSVFSVESETSIRQCLGDENQAIYDSESDESTQTFTSGTILTIPDSKRFGISIADVANTLALSKSKMVSTTSNCDRFAKNHTIFLFDENNISSVIASYANYLLSLLTDEEVEQNKQHGFYVLGRVHKKQEIVDPKRFPYSICDYWNGYKPEGSGVLKPQFLIDSFRKANNHFNDNNDTNLCVESICLGIRSYYNILSPDKITSYHSSLNSLCNQIIDDKQKPFRKFIFTIVSNLSISISNSSLWAKTIDLINSSMQEFFGLPIIFDNFVSWTQPEVVACSAPSNTQIFEKNETQRTIPINLGNIHSAKGRTHFSTLVVETFCFEANLKSLLPFLCGEETGAAGIRMKERMKCHYVAFTRPKALLCIAIPKNSIEQPRLDKLVKQGWRIKECN